MRITASIVTHRTDAEELCVCVECVLRCSTLVRLSIIDNSPDDRLRGCISEELVNYRHVENRGYGAGHNIALREAIADRSDCHLVLNADTCWQGDVITPMAVYMAAHSDVGMMIPKVYYPDGALQLTARRLPAPGDLLAKRFLPASLSRRRMARYLLERADHDRIIDSPYLPGSFLLLRREALEAEGIFDERFFMYPEDIDLTRRLHRRWRTLHYPAVSIEHRHAAASRHSLRMLAIHAVNMARYFRKWGWVYDPERRAMNRRLEAEMPLLPPDTPTPRSRG